MAVSSRGEVSENQASLPHLNYLWVGPPRVDPSGRSELGSDVKDVIDMAQKCENPISYFCLNEHVGHYQEIFDQSNANVKVKSIDSYLEEKKMHGSEEIRRYAEKMIMIKDELLKPPRNKIVDRVSFKDAFSLFLLACEGGYTIDTTVRPLPAEDKTKIKFDSYNEFKYPYYGPSPECWIMYASPNDLNVPLKMIDYYLSHWDKTQATIRGNFGKIESITSFHDKITSLTIDSMIEGLKIQKHLDDPAFKFTMEKPEDAENIAAIAKCAGVPILKTYGNSHKPEIECRKILRDEIKKYLETHLRDNEETSSYQILLKSLQLEVDKPLADMNEILKLNKIFLAIMDIDKLSSLANNIITKSNSEETHKIEPIRQQIDESYHLLNEHLLSGRGKKPNQIVSDLREKISKISAPEKAITSAYKNLTLTLENEVKIYQKRRFKRNAGEGKKSIEALDKCLKELEKERHPKDPLEKYMILVGLLKGHIEATRDTTPHLARSYQKALNTLPSEVQKWTETIRPDNTSLSNQNQIIAFKFLNNIQSVVIKAHPKLDNLIPHLQVLGDYFIDTKKLPYDKIILEIDKINSMLKNHRNAGPFIKKTDPNIILIENELKLLKKTAQSAHKIDKASEQTPAKNLKH